MKAAEAIKFAKSLPQDTQRAYVAPGEYEALRVLLSMAPDSLRRNVAKELLDRAECFRRADTPGHENWYHHHLEAAAFAANGFKSLDQGEAAGIPAASESGESHE